MTSFVIIGSVFGQTFSGTFCISLSCFRFSLLDSVVLPQALSLELFTPRISSRHFLLPIGAPVESMQSSFCAHFLWGPAPPWSSSEDFSFFQAVDSSAAASFFAICCWGYALLSRTGSKRFGSRFFCVLTRWPSRVLRTSSAQRWSIVSVDLRPQHGPAFAALASGPIVTIWNFPFYCFLEGISLVQKGPGSTCHPLVCWVNELGSSPA